MFSVFMLLFTSYDMCARSARARPAGRRRRDSTRQPTHHLSITAISGRVDAGERYEETSAERSADTSTRLSESVQTQTRDGAHHSAPLITRTLPHTHHTPHTRPNTRDARLAIHSSRVDSRQPTELYTRKLASTDRGVSACGLRRPKAANPPAFATPAAPPTPRPPPRHVTATYCVHAA